MLFNSCERLLLGTLIWTQKLEIEASDQNTQSDLIHHQTGNGLRHARGPIQSKHSTRYMYELVLLYFIFEISSNFMLASREKVIFINNWDQNTRYAWFSNGPK